MDTSGTFADAPWHDPDTIPLGVVVIKIRASSPGPIQLGQPGAQLLCLNEESFERLCAYEAGSLLCHVRTLVEMNKAIAAVEQDVLAMWAAGMYEGALHVRIMAKQTTSASSQNPIPHWQQILPNLWTDSHLWNAISRDTDMPASVTPFWDIDIVCMRDSQQNDWTLSELYQRLPSPPPAHEWDPCMLNPPQLQCQLYGYQQNSLAKMLQRELRPTRHCGPYYVEKTTPCSSTSQVDKYYFNPDTYAFYRPSSIPTYLDIKGGILCDEMGVGKTTVCLALILATLDQMPQPELNPMCSAVTSDMARAFPARAYQGVDPAHTHTQRIVTAAFGAPSPGERISRKPHKKMPQAAPKPALKRGRVSGTVSLVQIAAHRLRTTHACRSELRETLPLQLQTILGPLSAPYFLLWPPAPTHVSRQSQGRAPIRVYVTSATLVLVPLTLLVHWMEEIEKHCEENALRILTVSDMREELPRASLLAQNYDMVLMSHARFGKEACDEHSSRVSGNDSPLMQVYWKRVIIDEGDVLAGESLVMRLCARLRVERRWIVTDTPTQSTIGSSMHQTADKRKGVPLSGAPMAWMPCDRKNLDRLKQFLVRFLGVSPLCGTHADTHSDALAPGLPTKERDWHALMTSAPQYPEEEWPAKRRLYDLLSRVMVRNRTEDVQQECPLPPLEHRAVMLTFSELERLTYNVLQSLILLNATLSQEKDKDYLFHPSNKKLLTLVMENLALACFHFAEPGLLEQARNAKELLAHQLKTPGGVPQAFEDAATRALNQLQEALSSDAWQMHMRQGHIMYQLEGMRPDVCKAWSGSSDTHLTSEELLAFRKAIQDEAPKLKSVHDLEDRLKLKGAQLVQQKVGKRRIRYETSKPSKTKYTVTRCSWGNSQLSLSDTLSVHLPDIRIQRTSSTKLQHMVLEILAAVKLEKVLVFSSLEHVLYELSNILELLRVPSLMYVPGTPQHLRNMNASEFVHKDVYRCLLLSTAAGSRGLHLHCASRVILAEPIWQHDLESQVVKHSWRIGQKNRVLVSTYVMRDTLEQCLFERKRDGLMEKDDTLDNVRWPAEDPVMRDFVAHPQLVSSAAPSEGAIWAAKMFVDHTGASRSAKRPKLPSRQGRSTAPG